MNRKVHIFVGTSIYSLSGFRYTHDHPIRESTGNPMKKHLINLSAAVLLLLASSASAQTAPSSATSAMPPKTSEPVFELDPFEVKAAKDYGYQAANSVTATGIGTAIIDVPVNINVLTADYIRDRGATELRQIVNQVSSVNSDIKDESTITVRGFEALVQTDGSTTDRGFALDDAERVEIVKGPSSVFHGLVRPGGVINIVTAKPDLTRWSGQTKLTYGAYDFKKAYARVTGPLVRDRLALYASAARTDTDYYRDYTGKDETYYRLAATWRPLAKLRLTASFEDVDRQIRPQGFITTSHPAFQAADLAAMRDYDNLGLARPAEAPRIGETVRSWLNRTPGYGSREPAERIFIQEELFGSYRYNANGPDSLYYYLRQTSRGDFVWEVADWLTVRGIATHQKSEQLFRELNTFRVYGGQIFNEGFRNQFSFGDSANVKLEGAARFRLAGAAHSLLAGYEYRSNKSANVFGPTPRLVWNPRTQPVRRASVELAGLTLPPIAGYADTETDFLYVSDQVALFENRLRFLLGARQAWHQTGRIDTSKTTPQIGALLRPVPAISLFANYSETFEPSGLIDASNRPVGPITGEGSEVGVKIEAFDGRLSGALSTYRVKRSNIARRDFAREAELGILPLYILAGVEESSGTELDFTWTPLPNYQAVVTYAYMGTARTVNSGDANQIGVRLHNMPRHMVSVWNKYTFVKGPLKGFYLGGGVRHVSAFRVHPSWSVTIEEDGYTRVDALAGYSTTFGGKSVDFALNVENLLDEFYFDGAFEIGNPRGVFGSITVRL